MQGRNVPGTRVGGKTEYISTSSYRICMGLSLADSLQKRQARQRVALRARAAFVSLPRRAQTAPDSLFFAAAPEYQRAIEKLGLNG